MLQAILIGLIVFIGKADILSEQQCLEGRLYWVLWWELY